MFWQPLFLNCQMSFRWKSDKTLSSNKFSKNVSALKISLDTESAVLTFPQRNTNKKFGIFLIANLKSFKTQKVFMKKYFSKILHAVRQNAIMTNLPKEFRQKSKNKYMRAIFSKIFFHQETWNALLTKRSGIFGQKQ